MKKYTKTVKHYKTLRNCLKKNMHTRIYWNKYGYTASGAYWFEMSFYRNDLDKNKPVTLEYNDIYKNWELHFYLM